MDVLRTPDERFDDLPGFDFEPNYVEVETEGVNVNIRMHYVDEGDEDRPVILLLHGEPSWSYLYRTMIPPLVDAGFRTVAPDLVGLGRSDKPASPTDHTYERQVGWMHSFVEQLALTDINLFCQDWGGLIGLRLLAERPDWFARVIAANTGLPTGDADPGPAFMAWQEFSQKTPDLDIGAILQMGCVTEVSEEIVAAYNAPFPDDSYKACARILPALVPTKPDDPASAANRRAWEVLSQWDRPFLTAFSDSDPITSGGDRPLRERVPGVKGRPNATIEGAGHFLQEDKGPETAERVIAFITPQNIG